MFIIICKMLKIIVVISIMIISSDISEASSKFYLSTAYLLIITDLHHQCYYNIFRKLGNVIVWETQQVTIVRNVFHCSTIKHTNREKPVLVSYKNVQHII